MRSTLLLAGCLVCLSGGPPAGAAEVLVYGGTPGGVVAAVATARLGNQVTLVEPSRHLGGVVSGGLTRSDLGDETTIGGLAREFFDRCLAHYVATYGPDSEQVRSCYKGFYPEPKVAEQVFEAMLAEAGVTVVRGQHLVACEVTLQHRIAGITVADDAETTTTRLAADGFIDASYEGDLMAAALVPYTVGRESVAAYGESAAGIRWGPPEILGQGDHRVQAYNFRLCLTDRPDLRVMPEQPANYDPARYQRLLEFIEERQPAAVHLTLLNIMPVANGKYDTNNCGHAWQSTDWVGANYLYPEASWAQRKQIAQAHLEYAQGLLYFLQHDPRVPERLRREALQYGLPRDEFVDNGHWPHQLYVREARRMIGAYVFTQRDAREDRHKPDSIGIGSYTIDSHGCRVARHPVYRYLLEGGLGLPVKPYEIPYRILCPPEVTNLLVPVCCSASHVGYCTLRMEPVYMHLGHAAGVGLHLALAGGVGVREVAIDRLQAILTEQGAKLTAPFWPEVGVKVTPEQPTPGQAVTLEAVDQKVKSPLVRFRWDLDGDGQVDAETRQVTWTWDRDQTATVWLRAFAADGMPTDYVRVPVTVGAGGPAELVIDSETYQQSSRHGTWEKGRSLDGFLGEGYYHDGNRSETKGVWAFRFRPEIAVAGRYRVMLSYTAHPNRATNIPVFIEGADGVATLALDQTQAPGSFLFRDLGEYRFAAGSEGSVLIRTGGTDGHVVIDAARFVYLGP